MKALFIIVPILLVGGTFGAAKMGVVQIPGVSPKKVEAKKLAEGEQAPEQEQEPEQEPEPEQQADLTDPATMPSTDPQPTEPQTDPPTDPEAGAKALAKYWDAIPTNKLIPITDTYTERDLALVLQYMQKPKVAEIMGAIDADRAANLSRELQRLASIVKPVEETG
jgi:hypothetical protein